MSRGSAFGFFVFLLFTLAWCTDDNKHVTLHQAVVDYIVAVTPK